MAIKTVHCKVNGIEREYVVDVRESLADMLRIKEELHSVKKGCEVGECGACTVLINGRPFASCIYLAIWADGKEIETSEGLVAKDGSLSDIQQAFVDEGAIQCGFCTPGFIMASVPIINADRKYSRDEIRKWIAGNFCRCTGYERIVDAIEKTQEKRLKEKGLL